MPIVIKKGAGLDRKARIVIVKKPKPAEPETWVARLWCECCGAAAWARWMIRNAECQCGGHFILEDGAEAGRRKELYRALYDDAIKAHRKLPGLAKGFDPAGIAWGGPKTD